MHNAMMAPKVDIIILAAGKGERAGGFKMGLDIAGKPMVLRAVEVFRRIDGNIIVVGGYRIDKLREILAELPQVTIVENPDYEMEMFSSVQIGARHSTAERFFIHPGDCVLVPPWVPQKMLETDGDVVIPTFRGRGGHPVLMTAAVRDKILREPPSSNLKKVINSVGASRIEVDCDGILFDIDTKEDYLIARERYERGNFCAGPPRGPR